MHPSMAQRRVSMHRTNLAYVDIPPSPVVAAIRRNSLASPYTTASSSTLKENTPLRSSQLSMTEFCTPTTSLKRKMLDGEPSGPVFDGVVMSSKKSKLGQNERVQADEVAPLIAPGKDTVRCHQCCMRRDPRGLFHILSFQYVYLPAYSHHCMQRLHQRSGQTSFLSNEVLQVMFEE